jgi:hypothetical protein
LEKSTRPFIASSFPLFCPTAAEAHKLAAGFQERQFRLVQNLFLGRESHDYLNLKGREDMHRHIFAWWITGFPWPFLISS